MMADYFDEKPSRIGSLGCERQRGLEPKKKNTKTKIKSNANYNGIHTQLISFAEKKKANKNKKKK